MSYQSSYKVLDALFFFTSMASPSDYLFYVFTISHCVIVFFVLILRVIVSNINHAISSSLWGSLKVYFIDTWFFQVL